MKNKSIIVSLIIVICFIGVIFYVVSNKKEVKEKTEENIASITVIVPPSETNTETENLINTKDSMEEISKNGDVLSMNYTGRLTDGTVFDSNVDPKFNHVEPFTFTLGAGQVIKGWDEGLVGMKVGEKKTLTITPDKGYGSQAVSIIPPNSTLIFEVELVGINK